MYYSCMQVRSHYEVSIFSYRPNHDLIHACYVICSRKKVGESLEKEIKDAEASLSFYTCSLKRLNPIKNISEDTCYFWFNLVRKADDACTNHAGTLPPHGRSRKALLLSRYRKLCSLIGALHGGLWAVAVTVTS